MQLTQSNIIRAPNMFRLFIKWFLLGLSSSVLLLIQSIGVNGNDAEFGRVISFDNFEHFKASMNKSYDHEHIEKRSRAAYENNCRRIKEHNEAAQNGKYSFEIRANYLADLSMDAYMRRFIRLKPSQHPQEISDKSRESNDPYDGEILGATRDDTSHANLPDSLDWREKGFETPPKNQKSCGSCYAFSVAMSIEGQVFRRTGRLVPLSEQQIVDCSVEIGNHGCSGGSLKNTLKYLKSTRGLMRDVDYPYASTQQKCFYKPSLAVVNITEWEILPLKDEEAMKKAIATVGPIPISINASPQTFQLYSHGIYDDPECSDNKVNHAMLAVGYTPDYFILKNWWGDNWGEDGYMKIRRHRNMCGLSNYAAYARV